MDFSAITEHVITLFNNANKFFHENELNLQNEELSGRPDRTVKKLIKETTEYIALKKYLSTLELEALQKLCAVADFALSRERDFYSLFQANSDLDKNHCLAKLDKMVQYIPEGKHLLDHEAIIIR